MLHFLLGLLVLAVLLSFTAGRIVVAVCVLGAVVLGATMYVNEHHEKVAANSTPSSVDWDAAARQFGALDPLPPVIPSGRHGEPTFADAEAATNAKIYECAFAAGLRGETRLATYCLPDNLHGR